MVVASAWMVAEDGMAVTVVTGKVTIIMVLASVVSAMEGVITPNSQDQILHSVQKKTYFMLVLENHVHIG